MAIKHFPNCTGIYPEKPAGEKPQQIEELDIGDGERVLQCVDCGAFEIVPAKEGHNMKLNKQTIDEAVEAEYARVERMQMTAADRAELNQLIDEQREQDRLADEAYWEQQCEIEDQRRNDQ